MSNFLPPSSDTLTLSTAGLPRRRWWLPLVLHRAAFLTPTAPPPRCCCKGGFECVPGRPSIQRPRCCICCLAARPAGGGADPPASAPCSEDGHEVGDEDELLPAHPAGAARVLSAQECALPASVTARPRPSSWTPSLSSQACSSGRAYYFAPVHRPALRQLPSAPSPQPRTCVSW